ncbi:23S rRNA (uracil(1939)-C(5))-methyltransferase RlmD [Thalassomonas actiniarum]|uniref:23S rRNA (uracil(1939)-C(5))-methyltransferase RlmD n=1 Tax=Thalassomonas actiniarum TaxID=485447 RepID=A0AAE9YTI1_9GAMM|nr:23S rRNA (uracil(1939)-C(5))-methyltransferase RlmD [Thalassomonas actiniarum]WDE00039.1 23S rRNA (uracil(1939)-C(5))-methyltransferase RlmD [Thalassomonas actiniarum]
MANFFKASTKKHTLGQKITVRIERLDLNGCGVGYYQKKPVFVAGALVGETARVRVVEQKSKYLRGQLQGLENESKHRIAPFCRHYQKCGGCDLQHLAYQQQLNFKQDKVTQLFARNQINAPLPWQLPLLAGERHYRRKARIGVQYAKDGSATIGFRQKATNDLVALDACPVLVEPVTDIFALLKPLLASLSVKQAIGHIEVLVTGHITLIVRQLKPLTDEDKALWLQAATAHHWQILLDNGKDVLPLTRVEPLSYALSDGLTIGFTGKDFIQVNHDMNVQMVSQALDWLALDSGDKVLDLFCGLGNFSLPVAARVLQLTGVEGVQSMVERAQKNARDNGLENCAFYQADLNSSWQDLPWAQESFDKVLLDPARAGALEAIEQLLKFKIATLLYVSCDPATLARDSKVLLDAGYKIEKIAIMDMFSQTKHVETMVLFSYP